MILFGSVAYSATDYTEDFKIQLESTEQLGDYELRFFTSEAQNGSATLQYVDIEGDQSVIKGHLRGEELRNSVGERVEVDENFSFTVKDVNFVEEYVELEVTTSRDAFASSELSSDLPQRILISQDGTETVSVQLENTGVVNQTFNLSSKASPGISTRFSYQGFNVSNIFVPSGEEKTINTRIEAAEETDIGLQNLTIVADSGQTRADERLLLSIIERQESEEEISRMSLNLAEQYKRTSPGEELTVPVTVRNSGRTTLDNVNITVEGPEGWESEIRPSEISSMERFRSSRVTVTINPPANVESGDYFVDVSASSDQVGVEEPERLRVNISEKSGLRYVGVGLMAFSLLALVLVYRRFGRR
ncbi:Putative membrane protein [Candidatus Nanohalovita haloferacivicina]|nr:Putative membrane protein [Candidatus Nanohalobia archaeon BNXNv]